MKQPIKVVMIIHGYYPEIGGAERVLMALTPELKQKGIDLHIITRQPGSLPPLARVKGAWVHRLPSPGPNPLASFVFSLGAVITLLRIRPCLVHAHIMFSPGTIAAIAKALLKIPFVITVHRGGAAPFGEIARLKQKFFGKFRMAFFRGYADRFIVISSEIDKELEQEGVSRLKRRLIPNAVDVSRFSPPGRGEKEMVRRRLGVRGGPVAVFIGRLSREKRVDWLINTWNTLKNTHPSAVLLVVGDGPQALQLKAAAGEGVLFCGAVDDVTPFLKAADLFVLPSVAEGLSIALLEAMASGVPAVVTRLAGALDLIEDRENGWLIPAGDDTALLEAVTTLFDDPQLRQTLGENARQCVVSRYSLDVVAGQMYGLYRNLIRGYFHGAPKDDSQSSPSRMVKRMAAAVAYLDRKWRRQAALVLPLPFMVLALTLDLIPALAAAGACVLVYFMGITLVSFFFTGHKSRKLFRQAGGLGKTPVLMTPDLKRSERFLGRFTKQGLVKGRTGTLPPFKGGIDCFLKFRTDTRFRIALVEIKGEQFVRKSYTPCDYKFYQCIRNNMMVADLGISPPLKFVSIKERTVWIEFVRGTQLHDISEAVCLPASCLEKIFSQLNFFHDTLHGLGLCHLDLHRGNIIYREGDNKPVLIDLDESRLFKKKRLVFRLHCINDRKRLDRQFDLLRRTNKRNLMGKPSLGV